MNTASFFANIKTSDLFGGSLSQHQIDGMQAIIDQWGGLSSPISGHQLAYVLGTVYREAGRGMYPVREGFASTDEGSIKAVTDMYNRHEISHNYATLDPVTHRAYFGRGQVQITWADNYKAIGSHIGVDIYNNPDLVLQPDVSAKIAVGGMQSGWFTGKKLRDYISSTNNDLLNARRIINGTDHASLVAGYSTRFLTAIEASS